jgi:hypothetical protein
LIGFGPQRGCQHFEAMRDLPAPCAGENRYLGFPVNNSRVPDGTSRFRRALMTSPASTEGPITSTGLQIASLVFMTANAVAF